VLFIVPLRYLFAIGFHCIQTKHQYLAFDVSLPPPGYLSCSPKQLDSESKWLFGKIKENSLKKKECKTWLSHSRAVKKITVAFQNQNWTFEATPLFFSLLKLNPSKKSSLSLFAKIYSCVGRTNRS